MRSTMMGSVCVTMMNTQRSMQNPGCNLLFCQQKQMQWIWIKDSDPESVVSSINELARGYFLWFPWKPGVLYVHVRLTQKVCYTVAGGCVHFFLAFSFPLYLWTRGLRERYIHTYIYTHTHLKVCIQNYKYIYILECIYSIYSI